MGRLIARRLMSHVSTNCRRKIRLCYWELELREAESSFEAERKWFYFEARVHETGTTLVMIVRVRIEKI